MNIVEQIFMYLLYVDFPFCSHEIYIMSQKYTCIMVKKPFFVIIYLRS